MSKTDVNVAGLTSETLTTDQVFGKGLFGFFIHEGGELYFRSAARPDVFQSVIRSDDFGAFLSGRTNKWKHLGSVAISF